MSGWKDIVGHRDIIHYMEETVKEGAPSHAYLISGNQGSGKSLLSQTFAMALQCTAETDKRPCMGCHSCKQAVGGNHPDIIYLQQEKPRTISVEEIREQVVSDIGIKPYNGKYKIYIIENADKMTEQAQNALLKTLEEPPEYGIVFLITRNPEALLDTIRSRCVLLKLRNLKDSIIRCYMEEHTDLDEETISLCTAFAQGSLGKAIRLSESEYFKSIRMDAVKLLKGVKQMDVPQFAEEIRQMKDYKLEIEDYLDIMAVWFRDMLVLKATNEVDRLVFKDETYYLKSQATKSSYEGIQEILDGLQKARQRIKANVNFDITMELLLLTIKEN